MTKRWKDFERLIAKKFRRWWPDSRRGLQYQDGDYTPDVVGKGLPFYVECKTGEKTLQARIGDKNRHFDPNKSNSMSELYDLYLNRAIQWHKDNDGPDLPAIIVWRLNKKKTMVTIPNWMAVEYKLIEYAAIELVTIVWQDFQDALDKIYKIKEK